MTKPTTPDTDYRRKKPSMEEFADLVASKLHAKIAETRTGCAGENCQFPPETIETLNSMSKEYRDSLAFRKWVKRAVVAAVLAAGIIGFCKYFWIGVSSATIAKP